MRMARRSHGPTDFDAFWAAIRAEVDAIPLNPTMTPVPMRSTPEVAVYEIGYDSLDGVRIAGWYCVPREAYLPPPYPALLLVPGYISEPTLPKSWAKMGYAAVGVAPRGKLRSNHHYNPGYPGLLTDNLVDRNTYSYRGFYVDAARAVDFVLTRPEVDHTRIGVHGSSQGGALTITTAALRPEHVIVGAAGAPYLCGYLDAASLTHSWPYEEINDYLRLYPEREPQVRETLNYFDGINFAPAYPLPDAHLCRPRGRCLPAGNGLRRVRRPDMPEGDTRVPALCPRRGHLLGDAEGGSISRAAPASRRRGPCR